MIFDTKEQIYWLQLQKWVAVETFLERGHDQERCSIYALFSALIMYVRELFLDSPTHTLDENWWLKNHERSLELQPGDYPADLLCDQAHAIVKYFHQAIHRAFPEPVV